jgi:hypothetical protein
MTSGSTNLGTARLQLRVTQTRPYNTDTLMVSDTAGAG